MEARTYIILTLALVGVSHTSPVPNSGEVDGSASELLSSSKREENLPTSKLLAEESKLSQCEKSCRSCDATGKLQPDGSCKCYSDNGGEIVCLKPGVAVRDITGRGERCSSDTLGSATPSVLQSQALSAAQRSLEEFRQRVETLRELTMENMRRINLLGSAQKLPTLDLPALPNSEATLGIPALPKIEPVKLSSSFEIPALPKIELPSLSLSTPKLSTTFNLPSTLPNLPRLEPIKIPSLGIPKLEARIPDFKTTFQLPALPKLEIPKLPSLPTSNLPVSPYLGIQAKTEVEGEKDLELQEKEPIVAAPNPEENETEPKNGEISLDIPSVNLGSQLAGLSLPPLTRRGFLPSGQLNYMMPQFSARYPPSPRMSRSSQPNTSLDVAADKKESSHVIHEVETQSDDTVKLEKVE